MMSWPRSHGFPHSESLDGDGEHTPSEIRAYERLHMPDDASDHSQQVSDMAEACADPGTADEQGRWRCVTCQSASWDWENEQYRCRQCGSSRFFDTTRPFRVDMADGVWVFEPKSSPDQSPARSGSSFDLFGSTGDQVPHHTTSRSPPEPDDGQWNDGEYAESEQLTNDPTVDPDASDAGGRRRRRRRKPADVTTSGPQQQQQQVGMSDLLTVMKQLVNDKSSKPESTSAASWNSRRGPEPGIKWRGGTPPSPPLWKYSSSDLRAFSRWEKKIRIWQLQVRNYVSSADAALMLFTSLTGEAEQEVEHIDLAKVNAKDGVDYLLDALRGPLQQKELFQKRKLLSDYEQVSRMSHESIRQYINRYRRIEKDLESIGISSSTMYDSESRGNRVLERAKLSPEFQRLVLIGAGNTLEFDRVCESLLLQFPDFKPVPPIFSNYAGPGSNNSQGWRSSSGKGKASSSQSSAASTASGSSMGSSSFSKSSGKGRFPRKVLQTDIATGQDDEVNDDLPTVEEADEDEFHDPNDDDPEFDAEDHGGEHDEAADEASSESQLHSTIAEIAEVLTVTSKKLQSSVLPSSRAERALKRGRKTLPARHVARWAIGLVTVFAQSHRRAKMVVEKVLGSHLVVQHLPLPPPTTTSPRKLLWSPCPRIKKNLKSMGNLWDRSLPPISPTCSITLTSIQFKSHLLQKSLILLDLWFWTRLVNVLVAVTTGFAFMRRFFPITTCAARKSMQRTSSNLVQVDPRLQQCVPTFQWHSMVRTPREFYLVQVWLMQTFLFWQVVHCLNGWVASLILVLAS